MSEHADIYWRPIKDLYHYKAPNSDHGYEIRIGRWVVNGQELEIMLAKQEYKESVSGQKYWGKIKGLGANDMYRIFDLAREIADLMHFPLPKELSKPGENKEAKPKS